MSDRALYAQKGEEIVCEAGHVVTRPMRDLYVMEAVFGDMLEGMGHLKPGDASRGISGDVFPNCSCGERWQWFGSFRFRDGYRNVVGGEIVHQTLEQISGGWQDHAAEQGARELRN